MWRKDLKVVVVEAEQRAFQCHRQCQIVVWQQQRVSKIHQVDDRNVFGQL